MPGSHWWGTEGYGRAEAGINPMVFNRTGDVDINPFFFLIQINLET